MASVATLATVFGTKGGKIQEIGDLVSAFDFSKTAINTSKSNEYLNCSLAPSLGKLTSEGLSKMDDELKVMIAGTTTLIGKIPVAERSWDAVVSCCMQNPFLEPDGEGIGRADKIIKKSSSDFKTDGSPDSAIVREVETWFTNLIQDEDVLKSTKIDIHVLGQLVAQSGATVSDFESFFTKNERHEQHVLDIGILRYPDIDQPYFKVYRIKLDAWSDSRRILFHQEDSNGITGEFNARRFKPRKSVIDNLTAPAKAKAIQQAEALFS